MADGQPRIADLANQVAALAEQANALLLAEAKLAKPLGDVWRRRQLANSCGLPRPNLA
jgi:hypothetical protein